MAALFVGSIAAANAFAASAPSTTLTSTLVSDYFFRGQRLGGLSLQPAVELNAGKFVGGIVANFPVKDKVTDQSDPEVDFYASHSFSLNDAWRLNPGVTFYVYPNAPTSVGYHRSLIEPSIGLSHTVAGVRVTATCYYDATRKGPTFELAGAVALPLTTMGTELDLMAMAGDYRLRDASNNAGARTKLSGNYWSISASLPFQVTPSSNIRIGIAYTSGFNSHLKQGALPRTDNPLVARRIVAQLGYSLSF